MTHYYRMLMDEDERNEADRLNAEERAEEPEPATETPLERWCRVEPVRAASQISALQEAVRQMAPWWHVMVRSTEMGHAMEFVNCTEVSCRRLRARLRPFGG